MKPSFISGRLILAGEHAVVYGKMALATSISLGVKAQVVENEIFEKSKIVMKAVEVAGGDENIQVEIESNLPIGSGFGSSAAVAAAVIKSVKEYLGKTIDKDELFNLTLECEKLAHGNPSGIDPATVVYGGLIAYIKGQPFERLKIKKPIKLLLLNSGEPTESTKEMVEFVASVKNRDKIIRDIGSIVSQVRTNLVEGKSIAKMINMNGLLLEKLGVVGDKALNLSNELRELGANVKVTGAGGIKTGSGMMIVMCDAFTNVRKMLDNSQIEYFETEIGGQ